MVIITVQLLIIFYSPKDILPKYTCFTIFYVYFFLNYYFPLSILTVHKIQYICIRHDYLQENILFIKIPCLNLNTLHIIYIKEVYLVHNKIKIYEMSYYRKIYF